jgi:hypothetical protein
MSPYDIKYMYLDGVTKNLALGIPGPTLQKEASYINAF